LLAHRHRAGGGTGATGYEVLYSYDTALVQEIIFGDAAGTRTDSDYDTRRRLRNVQTYRGPPGIWTTPPANYTPVPAYNPTPYTPSTFQLVLQDQQLTSDVVGNPTEIRDYRAAADWPAGSKPVTKKIQ